MLRSHFIILDFHYNIELNLLWLICYRHLKISFFSININCTKMKNTEFLLVFYKFLLWYLISI